MVLQKQDFIQDKEDIMSVTEKEREIVLIFNNLQQIFLILIVIVIILLIKDHLLLILLPTTTTTLLLQITIMQKSLKDLKFIAKSLCPTYPMV